MSRRALLLLLWAVVAAGVGAVELEVWEYPRFSEPGSQDRYAWMRRLLERYQRENPEVKVRLTELTWKAGGDKLRIALFAGRPPDVVGGALDPALVAKDQLEPIDDFLTGEDRADYLPGALDGFRVGGKVYGWPWCRKGDYLYLNADAFEAAGAALPRDGQWTAEGFAEACRRLAARQGSDADAPYPLGLALAPGKSPELGLLLAPGRELLGLDGTYRFSGDGAAQALSRLARWRREGWIPEASPGWAAKDLWLAFTRNQSVAMAPFGLWGVKGLQKQATFRWELAALPPGVDGPALRPAVTVGYMVLRRPGRTAEETAAAQALARYLAGPVGQQELRTYGQFPTRASVGDLYADDAAMSRAARLLDGALPLPAHAAWGRLEEAFKREVQGYLSEAPAAEPGAAAPTVGAGGIPEDPARDATLKELEARARQMLTPPPEPVRAPLWYQVLVWILGLAALGAGLALARALAQGGLAPVLLAAPALSVLGLFLLVPAAQGFLMAVRQVAPGSSAFDGWVGLDNFQRSFMSPAFRAGCANTVLYAAVVVPGNLLAGLVLASWIHPMAKRWRSAFRGAFYLPGVASVVAMAIVWRYLLDQKVGLVNRLLHLGGGLPSRVVQWFLPALERVPLALGVTLGALVLGSLWLYLSGGGREPARRRLQRDLGVVAVAGLSLLWVLLGAGPWPEKVVELPWLTSPDLSFWSVMLMVLVRGPGGGLLVFLAALEAVDPELMEAAEVDGASAMQRFYHVTLPALAPTTFFLAVTGVIDSFQAFGPVFLLTDGGPQYSSTVVVHRMYLAAFRDLDFGAAAAQGTLLFLAVALIGAVQAASRRE
jgi:ABC-type sugar transport system permease subunit/maltose-binding protein MalE